jgi:flagellar motility protein MotE (MotC chaperone)
MSSKLRNPAVVAALAIMLSVTVGVMAFWSAAAPLIEAAMLTAAKNKKASPIELKERGWDFWTIEIENLSSELKGERDRLRQQHDQLDQRAAQLANEARELAKVRIEIEALRRGITEKIIEISADDAKNIRTLAQAYSNLTPRAVVAIVRELDDATAVKIFSLMKVDVVSAIFEEMSRTAGPDGPMSKRVAILSERMRQMKSVVKPAAS